MLFLEYLASFAPEFESCYIFAQVEKRDSLHEIQDVFRLERAYVLRIQAKHTWLLSILNS